MKENKEKRISTESDAPSMKTVVVKNDRDQTVPVSGFCDEVVFAPHEQKELPEAILAVSHFQDLIRASILKLII
jgi:hypothetical protein